MLVLFLAILMCVQMNATAATAASGESMRGFLNEKMYTEHANGDKQIKTKTDIFTSGSYLALVLLAGTYILMRKKKSRKIDF